MAQVSPAESAVDCDSRLMLNGERCTVPAMAWTPGLVGARWKALHHQAAAGHMSWQTCSSFDLRSLQLVNFTFESSEYGR